MLPPPNTVCNRPMPAATWLRAAGYPAHAPLTAHRTVPPNASIGNLTCSHPQTQLVTGSWQLPAASSQPPAASWQLPAASCQLPTAIYRPAAANCQLPAASCHRHCQLPAAGCLGGCCHGSISQTPILEDKGQLGLENVEGSRNEQYIFLKDESLWESEMGSGSLFLPA